MYQKFHKLTSAQKWTYMTNTIINSNIYTLRTGFIKEVRVQQLYYYQPVSNPDWRPSVNGAYGTMYVYMYVAWATVE